MVDVEAQLAVLLWKQVVHELLLSASATASSKVTWRSAISGAWRLKCWRFSSGVTLVSPRLRVHVLLISKGGLVTSLQPLAAFCDLKMRLRRVSKIVEGLGYLLDGRLDVVVAGEVVMEERAE